LKELECQNGHINRKFTIDYGCMAFGVEWQQVTDAKFSSAAGYVAAIVNSVDE